MAGKSKQDDTTTVTQTPAEAGGIERTSDPEKVTIRGAETINTAPAADRVVLTAEPKREADRTSYPTGGAAFPEDPPVRAARPDTPIVDSLGTGAGAHVPPDPDEFTPDGRVRDLPGQDD